MAPSPRDCVTKLFSREANVVEANKTKAVYKCNKCKNSYKAAVGIGVGNIYKHLQSCYGGEANVLAAYDSALAWLRFEYQ
jgi:hypothetical protein